MFGIYTAIASSLNSCTSHAKEMTKNKRARDRERETNSNNNHLHYIIKKNQLTFARNTKRISKYIVAERNSLQMIFYLSNRYEKKPYIPLLKMQAM